MTQVTKTFDGKKFHYYINGNLYKNSTRDFKYACVGTSRKTGESWILSLGNNRQSTYNSKASLYRHLDLQVIEIQ